MKINPLLRERYLWKTNFYSTRRIEKLPYVTSICCSRAFSHGKYYVSGKFRIADKNMYAFQYTIKGYGILRIGDKTYKIGEKQAFLIEVSNPEVSYYLPKENNNGWEFLFIDIEDGSGLTKQIIKECGQVYDLKNHQHIIQKMLNFKENKKKIQEISMGESMALVKSLLCSLLDISSADHMVSNNTKIIRKAYKLIEENIAEPYNGQMLAKDLEISQEYLCSLFAKEAQTSPYKLILKLKIQEACILLKNTNNSIKEIAVKVGCEPGSHFARIFKREIGILPSEFRKNGIMPY